MRTILITGANSEISSNYIHSTYADYDKVIACYGRRHDRIDELRSSFGDKIIPIQADLADMGKIEVLVERLKEYKINEFLHLAAPGLRHMRFAKGDLLDFEIEMRVVYWSFMRICQTIIPAMCKKNQGRIVAVLTEYTVIGQPPFLSHYISAKYALLGLVKALAVEYGSKGIRVNGLSPGMIETEFVSKLPHYVVENNARISLRGRNLNVDDVIPMMSYLLSKEADSVNGQNILLQ